MHMSDALVSPAVGGTLWAVSAAVIAYCSSKVRRNLDEHKVPLMGVLGAFVFAAQMINFTIPATGSSGHLGGGLLLAILLGPAAAFLTIASVLMVQALFFADGGLLALGCNIINLGAFPALVAYPLIYKKLIGRNPRQSRMVITTIIAAVIGLQLGSLGVVLQTVTSGVSALPFTAFLLMMQPIHLAIGGVEGVVTALVVSFVHRARPEVLDSAFQDQPLGELPVRTLLVTFLVAALLLGGALSWFASEKPDGLEWSIAGIIGPGELTETATESETPLTVSAGYTEKSLSGVVGGTITLAFCLLIGFLIRRWAHDSASEPVTAHKERPSKSGRWRGKKC